MKTELILPLRNHFTFANRKIRAATIKTKVLLHNLMVLQTDNAVTYT